MFENGIFFGKKKQLCLIYYTPDDSMLSLQTAVSPLIWYINAANSLEIYIFGYIGNKLNNLCDEQNQ